MAECPNCTNGTCDRCLSVERLRLGDKYPPPVMRAGTKLVATADHEIVNMMEFNHRLLVATTQGIYQLVEGELSPIAVQADFDRADREAEARGDG